MRIIFFGTSEFAVPALEALIKSSHEVVSIITQPKTHKGRGLKVLPQPVELYASKKGLVVRKFEDINSKEAFEFLKEQEAEAFVIVSFGQIFSKEVLEIPALYPINIHASILPKYRGAAPIHRAIINGEKRSGVTIMRVSVKLDHGDIIFQKELAIGDDEDAASLSARLSSLAAPLLIETLDQIAAGSAPSTPQDDPAATYAHKLSKEDGLIDWSKDAPSIKNLVRGCSPWPSAYTYLDGKVLKILKVDISEGAKGKKQGSVIETTDKGIKVSCGKGAVLIERLQIEGKKPLAASEFLRGRTIPEGTVLGGADV
ncbi:MAG: methionyl-tRNA formyltransferase [Candidatus Omnitrophica bacterium]|nr:methionyl-tRNA formyltransferase [Candidatus Omnitrophota bacterium]